MKVSRRRWLGIGMLMSAGVVAGDPVPDDAAGPDLELLEYLGGLVNEDDKWVGPDDMQNALDIRDREAFPDDKATAEVVQ